MDLTGVTHLDLASRAEVEEWAERQRQRGAAVELLLPEGPHGRESPHRPDAQHRPDIPHRPDAQHRPDIPHRSDAPPGPDGEGRHPYATGAAHAEQVRSGTAPSPRM
jgi:hypothetical protein